MNRRDALKAAVTALAVPVTIRQSSEPPVVSPANDEPPAEPTTATTGPDVSIVRAAIAMWQKAFARREQLGALSEAWDARWRPDDYFERVRRGERVFYHNPWDRREGRAVDEMFSAERRLKIALLAHFGQLRGDQTLDDLADDWEPVAVSLGGKLFIVHAQHSNGPGCKGGAYPMLMIVDAATGFDDLADRPKRGRTKA